MSGTHGQMETIIANLRHEQQRLETHVARIAEELKEAETKLKAVKDSLRPLTGCISDRHPLIA